MRSRHTVVMLLLLWLMASVDSKQAPPPPQHTGGTAKLAPTDMAHAFSSWKPHMPCNIWELSGQHEGDIMLEDAGRNAVSDPTKLWPGGVVPYYIDTDDFDKEERKIIRGAVKNIEEETCIEFRPYKEGDSAYVTVSGDKDGCWSYVGRKAGGQTLNLSEKCVRHGVAVHELLHALGLHHQQSAHDRDNYVTIHWDNIEQDHKHNFDKYNSTTVTDYGVGYDYSSIMHYSAYAFSKNDKMTITAKAPNVTLRQQEALSEKDINKLRVMYKCRRKPTPASLINLVPFDNEVKLGQRKSLSKKDIEKLKMMYNCTKSKSDEEESSEMSSPINLFSGK